MKPYFSLFILFYSLIATASPIISSKALHHPVYAKKMMVASQEEYATKVGLNILRAGGNAIDAAVSIGYTLAVTLPKAGNLGGGGFMLYFNNKTKKVTAINFREIAPALSTQNMFLDKNKNVDEKKSRYDLISSGVPGTVKGLNYALKKYGTISLKKAITPAYQLAKKGIKVREHLFNDLSTSSRYLKKDNAAKKIFYPRNKIVKIGRTLRQKDLAHTLNLIMKNGDDGFYKGEVAQKIIAMMKRQNGIISLKDLENYYVTETDAVTTDFLGHQVYSMPPPSSGGIHLLQMLNMLENYPLQDWGVLSAKTIHHMAEVMKLAYADRSQFLGDPKFEKIPTSGLISKKYSRNLLSRINSKRATSSKMIGPGNPLPYESPQTTHYSVIDKYGNMVAVTTTLNFSFGNGKVVPGAGFFLNNEMDDFSSKPGVPNAYGLIGGKLNSIEPGKRPLSSMTPTIVLKKGLPFLVTGSPGGSRIITTVTQIILNTIVHKMNIAEATATPRIHHQWLPDEIRVENGISSDTLSILKKMGHKISLKNAMGSTQSIMSTKEGLYGSSDPRRKGALTLGD